MKSAFRTFVSGIGVCAACYILTTATWVEVLLAFLATSLGWCIYTCLAGATRRKNSQGIARKPVAAPVLRPPDAPEPPAYASPPALAAAVVRGPAADPAVCAREVASVRAAAKKIVALNAVSAQSPVYRFPMEKLANSRRPAAEGAK